MYFFGALLRNATIPMALLTFASALAGIALLLLQFWKLVVFGLGAFGVCIGFAALLERIIIQIDDMAALTLQRNHRHTAYGIALVSALLPAIVILGWEYACFLTFLPAHVTLDGLVLWLWSYGIATGPWTILALHVSRFRRTLCGIRSYSAHLSYWILSALVIVGNVDSPIALLVMAVPTLLPIAVGILLAVADRDALTNVRI